MAVAVVIRSDGDVRGMVQWGARFAQVSSCPLLALHVSKADDPSDLEPIELSGESKGLGPAIRTVWNEATGAKMPESAAEESAVEDGSDSTKCDGEISFFRLKSPNQVAGLLPHLSDLAVDLLVLPAALDDEGVMEVLNRATCAVMLLRSRPQTDAGPIVIPTVGRQHDHDALRFAADLGEHLQRDVHAVHVERDLDDVSTSVGMRAAARCIALALPTERTHVRAETVLSDKVDTGIRQASEGAELLVLGTGPHRPGGKPLHACGRRMLKWEDGPSVAVLRPPMPLHHRFRHSIELWMADHLPQMTRDERITLVDRIKSGARFNVDFAALICLSTLIAALGLARDQGAVIIGAMLVAPLMTPLMGIGLSLMQGNRELAVESTKSVVCGFALALALSMLVGLLIVNLEASSEMSGRGSPGVLDLLVAFVSGMAAAYAAGRPGLAAALPGVAIAAALVPPIATAGMSLAIGDVRLALGALLLFLTNIVAIALGAAVGLWAVGVRAHHQHGGYERWSAWVVLGLVVVTIGLAVLESQPGISFASLSDSLEVDLRKVVHQFDPKADLRLKNGTIQREDGKTTVMLNIDSTRPLSSGIVAALHKELAKHVDGELEVDVVNRLRFRQPPPD